MRWRWRRRITGPRSPAAFFETAPYHRHGDPLERVLGYLEFRKAILKGDIAEFTCLVGTMVQEIYGTNPDIREACEASISAHAATIEADIAEAMKRHRIRASWTAAEPGAAYAGGAAGRVHPGQSQGRRGGRGRQHRSSAPLHRVVVSNRKVKRRNTEMS